MIVTFLIWVFIFIVCFSYGLFFIRLFNNNNNKEYISNNPSNIISVFFVGFILCYIFSSTLSLFLPIGWIAFILILIPAIFLLVKNAAIRQLALAFKSIANSINPMIFIIVIIPLLFFTLWLTSGDIKNSDTYIYHAQSIHWIESYPVIKGIGNFFNRLAYNSGWFVQNALFSFSFLGERSFHVLNGLLIFSISLFFILEFIQASKQHQIELPHIWGLIIIPLGIISIGTQASAPSTDMPVAYLAWFAGYLSMKFNKQDNKIFLLFIITGVIAFAITIKISLAPLFLLPITLALLSMESIKIKKLVPIAIWIGLIMLPWMIRNVIISGYVIYPSAATAMPFEWRIPESLVKDDAYGIRAFGFYERAPAEEVMSKPYFERIKFWYFNLTTNQKMMVLVSLFTPLILPIIFLVSLVRNKLTFSKSILITITSFFAGFLFWILVSPNLRFGYVYILFLFSICLAAGIFWVLSIFNLSQKIQGYLGVVGIALILSLLFARSFNSTEFKSRYLYPKDYDHKSTQPCSIDGGKATVLCASEYGACGYYPFPCHAWGNEAVRMYGDELIDGFYMILPNNHP